MVVVGEGTLRKVPPSVRQRWSARVVGCPGSWRRIPHLHPPVVAPRDDAGAVVRKCHAADPFGVTDEGEEFLSALRLPYLHRLVKASRDDTLAIGGEGYGMDPVAVPLEGE